MRTLSSSTQTPSSAIAVPVIVTTVPAGPVVGAMPDATGSVTAAGGGYSKMGVPSARPDGVYTTAPDLPTFRRPLRHHERRLRAVGVDRDRRRRDILLPARATVISSTRVAPGANPVPLTVTAVPPSIGPLVGVIAVAVATATPCAAAGIGATTDTTPSATTNPTHRALDIPRIAPASTGPR